MIVKIAAWLYIINAALTLSSLSLNPFGMLGGSSSNLAILMMAGLSGYMGYGLLKQKPWARWLALHFSVSARLWATLYFTPLSDVE